MTLAEIKSELGITNLELNKSLDQNKVWTKWWRQWKNDSRVQISIHNDVVTAIEKNPSITNLGIKTETRTSETSGMEYTNKIIFAYPEAEKVL